MQKGIANVFCVYRHANLNESELIAERVPYNEMCYALQEEELAKMINCNALSIMASFAEYDALLTRCHIWEVDAGLCDTERNKESACSNVDNCEYEEDKSNIYTSTSEYIQNCSSKWNNLVKTVAMEITQHLPRSSLIESGRASHQLHCAGAFVLCRQESNFWSNENCNQNNYSANTKSVHNKYHMGVITHGAAHDIKVENLINRLSMNVFYAYPHYKNVNVPIAADLRRVQLKVWWTPSLERVTPLSTLPPLRVTLEEVCSPQLCFKKEEQQCNQINNNSVLCDKTNAKCISVNNKDKHDCFESTTRKKEEVTVNTDDTLYFAAYTKVELFLCRPVYSELIGTCVQYVKHSNSSNTQLTKTTNDEKENVITGNRMKNDFLSSTKLSTVNTQTTITEQVQKPLIANDIASHNTKDVHISNVNNNCNQSDDKVQMKKIWSRSSRSGVMHAHLIFDDLAVTHTGEHLIGVQVEVDKPYRPFVPVLCAYINPFLVVERDDAENEVK